MNTYYFIFATVLSFFTFQQPGIIEKASLPTLQIVDMTNNTYEELWKQVEGFTNQGLPESALKIVDQIIQKATKENNQGEYLKALLYQNRFQQELSDDGISASVDAMEGAYTSAKSPEKEVLASVIGELYSNYLGNNYWTIRERTDTGVPVSKDIATWSPAQLQRKATAYYQASVANDALQSIPLTAISPVVQYIEFSKVRPSIYDLLVERAIQFLGENNRYEASTPNTFLLNDPLAFAKASTFVKAKFATSDSTDQTYQTLLLYQNWLEYLLAKGDEEVWASVDMQRLQWINNHIVIDKKDERYRTALSDLAQALKENNLKAEAWHKIAESWVGQAQSYTVGNPDTTHQMDLVTAMRWCDDNIKAHPNTMGAKASASLKNQLLDPNLAVTVEQVNLPKSPWLIRLDYSNTKNAMVRVIPWTETLQRKLGDADYRELYKVLALEKPTATWEVNLPDQKDLRIHSTEIKGEPLPLGDYVIMVTGENPDKAGAYANFHVSNLGFWVTKGKETNDMAIIDRQSGKPISDVEVTFIQSDYNRKTNIAERKEVAKKTSNKEGMLSMPAINRDGGDSYWLRLKKGDDVLELDQSFYTYWNRYEPRPFSVTQFYLDRAIYRPGQTVFYKAILFEKDSKSKPSLLKSKNVEITLRDANGQEVGKQSLRSNEYGSVSGSFVLPSGGLLGQFSINSSISGSQSFRMEEYKRPKFAVEMDPVEGDFSINDEVTTTGVATALAGYPIDGAEVRYRVVREVRYPWWPWYWSRWMPSGNSMEIARGTTTTDGSGKFTIKFQAIPDNSVNPKNKPVFNYSVYADVVDIAGETRSAQSYVQVGTVGVTIQTPFGEKVETAQLDSIPLIINNLNGSPVDADGTVSMVALQAPKALWINRYWEAPDVWSMDASAYAKYFPHIAYANQDEPSKFPKGETFLSQPFSVKGNGAIAVGKKVPTGFYQLTIGTKDKKGTPVELTQIIEVVASPKTNSLLEKVGQVSLSQASYEPGEDLKLNLETSLSEELSMYIQVIKQDKIVREGWRCIKKSQVESWKIEESDRGNYQINVYYGALNRGYSDEMTVIVPWSNKDLQVEWLQIRDKMLPGEEATWILKIKGPKGDKVAAELVAGMYDASLDQLVSNQWARIAFPTYYSNLGNAEWWGYRTADTRSIEWLTEQAENIDYNPLPSLNLFGLRWEDRRVYFMRDEMVTLQSAPRYDSARKMKSAPAGVMEEAGSPPPPAATNNKDSDGVADMSTEEPSTAAPIAIRENLNETVFFYPEVGTDKEGNYILQFKMNEALTKWKLLLMGHTTDLQTVMDTRSVVTQKDIMVQPNPPRFLREFDEIQFSAKVVNMTDATLNGTATLDLVNPITGKKVFEGKDEVFTLPYTVAAKSSAPLLWTIKVPSVDKVALMEYTVIVKAGAQGDGEKGLLPVLTNRMLVTETMPIFVKGGQTKTVTFDRLKNNISPTLTHHQVQLEFSSNPAWYAVQALPYLMEYPYDCTEQIFSRLYANTLATSAANSHPRIKQVFEAWRSGAGGNKEALLSNLQKNEALKYALLTETPWVMDAQSEATQKQNIGLLFDLNKMSYEQKRAFDQLKQRQSPSGGFAWFPGGRDSWYITQYIAEGFGHLGVLGAFKTKDPEYANMMSSMVSYCDGEMMDAYRQLAKQVSEGRAKWDDDHLSAMMSHYLYMRTYYLEGTAVPVGMSVETKKAYDYWLSQGSKYWLKRSIYEQGMIGLATFRAKDEKTSRAIMASLKERAVKKDDLGMYWKLPQGYWWYEHPIETQALLIEAFSTIMNDTETVDMMKQWLLINKQTNRWKTTKATAAAVYSLLLNGSQWLAEEAPVSITMASAKDNARIAAAQSGGEAGTGYFKLPWTGTEVSKELATVTVKNPNSHIGWGSMYWQYMEQLDKITSFAETPLKINKKVFKVTLGDKGEVLVPVDKTTLQPGDKLKVRIEIRVDRPMEFVHLKDMRASGLEPIEVLSAYKWQDGLGYYESPGDLATNFFMDYLPKGTYVFEYPLRVQHRGDFSNGITTMQCMYAPEFTTHSEGVRILVK